MGYEDNIRRDLARLLQEYYGLDVAEVTSFEDTTASGGYCETCCYEYAAVRIYYLNSNGNSKSYLYDGGFSELINALDTLGD